ALVGRVAVSSRAERKHLPEALLRSGEEIDEAMGLAPEVADAEASGERRRVEDDPPAAPADHGARREGGAAVGPSSAIENASARSRRRTSTKPSSVARQPDAFVAAAGWSRVSAVLSSRTRLVCPSARTRTTRSLAAGRHEPSTALASTVTRPPSRR